jgi:4-oxalocrotonate tautomerase
LLRRGKSTAYLAAIVDGIYAALRETFDVPSDDRFMLVTWHDADEFEPAGAVPP